MIAYAGDKELGSLLVGDLCRLQPRVASWGPAQDSHFWSVGNTTLINFILFPLRHRPVRHRRLHGQLERRQPHRKRGRDLGRDHRLLALPTHDHRTALACISLPR